MDTIEFFMPMKKPPTVTHQEKQINIRQTVKTGRPVYYEPQKLKQARADLMDRLSQYRPEKPFTTGCRLVTRWLFPPGRHEPGTYRTTRPDTDNLQKLLKDCMTDAGFWQDDALVASELCEKFWAQDEIHTGIYIRVETL